MAVVAVAIAVYTGNPTGTAFVELRVCERLSRGLRGTNPCTLRSIWQPVLGSAILCVLLHSHQAYRYYRNVVIHYERTLRLCDDVIAHSTDHYYCHLIRLASFSQQQAQTGTTDNFMNLNQQLVVARAQARGFCSVYISG